MTDDDKSVVFETAISLNKIHISIFAAATPPRTAKKIKKSIFIPPKMSCGLAAAIGLFVPNIKQFIV